MVKDRTQKRKVEELDEEWAFSGALDEDLIEAEIEQQRAEKARFDEVMKSVDVNDPDAVFDAFTANFNKIFGGSLR